MDMAEVKDEPELLLPSRTGRVAPPEVPAPIRSIALLGSFDKFISTYVTYSGSLGDFIRACVYLKRLQQRRALLSYLYDDFIRAFYHGYVPYVDALDEDETALSGIEWYNENVEQPLFTQNVVTRQNLSDVLQEYSERVGRVRASLSGSQSFGRSFDTSNVVEQQERFGENEGISTATASLSPVVAGPVKQEDGLVAPYRAPESRKVVSIRQEDGPGEDSEEDMEKEGERGQQLPLTTPIPASASRLSNRENELAILPSPKFALHRQKSRSASTQTDSAEDKAPGETPQGMSSVTGTGRPLLFNEGNRHHPPSAVGEFNDIPPPLDPSTPILRTVSEGSSTMAPKSGTPALAGTRRVSTPASQGKYWRTLTRPGGLSKSKSTSRRRDDAYYEAKLKEFKEHKRGVSGSVTSTAHE